MDDQHRVDDEHRVDDQPKPVTGTEPGAAAEKAFETIFPVSAATATAAPLFSSPTASPQAAVTLEDGRWSWGVVDTV